MILAKDLLVYVKTTDTCNLNCHHCYTSGSKGKKVFFNPVAVSDFLIGLSRAKNLSSMRLMYHGGEPMIAPLEQLWKFHELTKDTIAGVNYGIQTNLVYPLDSAKIHFLETVVGEVGIGTSWDAKIRFGSAVPQMAQKQLELWESNVRTLVARGLRLTLMVALSKHLIQNYEPQQIIRYAIDLGFKYLLFERITSDGNAKNDLEVLPRNVDIDQWIFLMYQQTKQHQFNKLIGNMFLEEMASSVLSGLHVANRCRSCETKLITINADGGLAGCPNSAPLDTWVHVQDGFDAFLNAPKRVQSICSEKLRRSVCYTCDLSPVCNGDCYKLKWDGDICSAPKALMRHLSGNPQERVFVKELII